MFLCGGVISKSADAKPENLRDYLCRVRPLKLHHPIILAEGAVELYRKTHYHDLISFEEDLARIASVVLVIVESPGSFAELGAFASNDTIRKALKVIIQEEYETAESFVRYGPVERVSKAQRSDLGVYPWRMRAGKLVVRSTISHYSHIKKFFNLHLDSTPRSMSFGSLEDAKLFTSFTGLFLFALRSRREGYSHMCSLSSRPQNTMISVTNCSACSSRIGSGARHILDRIISMQNLTTIPSITNSSRES